MRANPGLKVNKEINMQSLPSLKRYLAAGLTVAVFAVGAHRCTACPVSGNESSRQAQPADGGAARWPMFGGSPSRNMVNLTAKNLPVKWTDDDGDIIKENVLWSADLGSRAYGGPMVAGGKVFVGTNNQAPRDPKYKTVKTLRSATSSPRSTASPSRMQTALQEIVDNLPLGKEVECTILRDGKASRT